MKWTIKRKLIVVFVFVASMMGGGTGVAYWAQLRGQATEKEIARTSQILRDLEYLNSYVRAVTAMQRAYLISGDEQAVASIPAVRQDANEVIVRVTDTIGGDPEQSTHLQQWKDLARTPPRLHQQAARRPSRAGL